MKNLASLLEELFAIGHVNTTEMLGAGQFRDDAQNLFMRLTNASLREILADSDVQWPGDRDRAQKLARYCVEMEFHKSFENVDTKKVSRVHSQLVTAMHLQGVKFLSNMGTGETNAMTEESVAPAAPEVSTPAASPEATKKPKFAKEATVKTAAKKAPAKKESAKKSVAKAAPAERKPSKNAAANEERKARLAAKLEAKPEKVAGAGRSAYVGKKITVVNKDHGARPGTKRADAMDILIKSKTTDAALEAFAKMDKVDSSFIAYAVKSGFITLA